MQIKHLLFLILLICSLTSIAATETTLSTQEVQSHLDQLANKKLPEQEAQTAKSYLEQALQFVSKREDSNAKLEDLRKRLANTPDEITQAKKQLDSFNATPPKDIQKLTKETDNEQLQQYLLNDISQLNQWQNALIDINNSLLQAQIRPEQIQKQISEFQNRLQEITSQLSTTQDNASLGMETRLKLQAEQQAIHAQTELLQQELSSSSAFQELANIKRNLLTQQIAQLKQETTQLQTIISQKRQNETEQTVKTLNQTNTKDPNNSLLAEEINTNLSLSEFLLKSTQRLNELSNISLDAKNKLDTVNHIDETLAEQINALKGSTLLSKVLYQQKKLLPSIESQSGLANEIANLRLYQFKLNQQREAFSDPKTYINKLTKNQTIDPDTTKQLLSLAQKRAEFYTSLQTNLSQLITETINLQLTQKQLTTKTSLISNTIDQQMFWIPSNSAININWLKNSPTLLKKELSNLNLQEAAANISRAFIDKPWLFIPALLIIFILLIKRKKIIAYIDTVNHDVGNVKKDAQYYTPLVLLLNILLALPVMITLALAGLALILDGHQLNIVYGQTLLEISLGWLIFYTTYRILSPKNLATIHFHWQADQTLKMRSYITKLGIITLLLISVVAITSQQLDNLANDVLGIIIVMLCYLFMGVVLIQILLNKESRKHLSFIQWIVSLSLVAIPFILLIATTMGYYYTALKLTDRLINTLYIIFLWVLIESLLIRSLTISARRIAYQRAIEKRQTQLQAREQGQEEIIEEPILDIETISQQTLKMIRLILITTLLGMLYFIWADVLAVLSYLNTITLYQYTDTDNTTLIPLTLMGLIVAVAIFVITILLVRNLPGLLEVLILSKLSLPRGSSYAITTLLSYIIIAIGGMSTLTTLGVGWDKLKWLVTGLTVGLGFGLQEIFANFVSGIIILFERPIRIGDYITVSGVTGTVNRIQIRATRITDSDRKEVIIPNKTFVTSQLTNWTLTDTITRITLTIGVGYGSDLNQVKQLLLQAANENERTLKEPGASVSFINFGESTLDNQLSVLVKELSDRSAAMDEINRRVLELFTEADIDIAFRQLEVTLKNNQGKELTLTQENINN